MNLSFVCLFLCICVHVVDVRAEEEGFEPECMDNLSNCPELARQGLCQSNEINKTTTECALSCGLCARKIMLFDRIVRSRSRPASRPVVRSRPASRPASRPVVRSRPAARSRPAPVRRRPAARPRVRQVRPRARQARPKVRQVRPKPRPKVRQVRPKPANARTKSTNSRSRPSSSRGRPSNPRARAPPRTRAQPRKQPATRELGRGTVEGSFPQAPMGVGIVQSPPDALPLSELAETKTAYLRMSGKMASMNVYAGRVIGAVSQAATWVEHEVSSYVLGRYVVSSYDMVQSRVKRSSEKNWVTKIKEAAADAASLVQQTTDVKAEMEKIMSRMQKHMSYFKNRANIANSLKSFSTDFGRTLEVVKKIEVTLLPAKNTLTIIVQTVDTVQGNNDEMKKLAEKLRENAKTFQTIGDETKALDEEIKKVGKDFENNVQSISTHKGDMQIVREPENPQAFEPKKEEPKKEPETNDNGQQTTTPAPTNGNQQSGNDSNPPPAQNNNNNPPAQNNNNNNNPPPAQNNNNNPPAQNNNNNNNPPPAQNNNPPPAQNNNPPPAQNNNPPPAQEPDEGPVLTLRCQSNGKFIAEGEFSGVKQMACKDSGNTAQKFHIIKQSDNKYALKTDGTKKFCTGDNTIVKCEKTSITDDADKFTKADDSSDKTFTLQCSNGKFVSADANNGRLTCSKEQADATKFAVFDESGSAQQN